MIAEILQEQDNRVTILINGQVKNLIKKVEKPQRIFVTKQPGYVVPSRRNKIWWKVTGEGRGHSQEKKIVWDGIHYKSIMECERQTGISKSTISRKLKTQKI